MEEAIDNEWRTLSEEILSGMKEWRLAHPDATFREIEQAASEQVSRRASESSTSSDGARHHDEQLFGQLAKCPPATTTGLSYVRKEIDSTRKAHPPASRQWRSRRRVEPQLWNLSLVRDGLFSPSMSN